MSYNKNISGDIAKNYNLTDADIDERLTAVEFKLHAQNEALSAITKLPAIPSTNASYNLKVSGAGTSKTSSWEKILLPALPTAEGNYTLKVTVSGSTKSYAWEAVTEAVE